MWRRIIGPLKDGNPHIDTSFSFAQIKGTGTTALFGSENVDSITDNAGGDYTITWTLAYTASTYAVMMSTSGQTGATTRHFGSFRTIAAASVRTRCNDWNSQAETDPDMMFVATCGRH